jgi:hypothetical protein
MIYEIILSFSFKFVIVYSVYFHERILLESLRVCWSSYTPLPPPHSIPLILQIYQNEWEINFVCSALLYDTSSVTAAATVSASWSVRFCLHFLPPPLPSATGSRNKNRSRYKTKKTEPEVELLLFHLNISRLNQWAATIGFVDEYGVLSSIIDLYALRHLIVVDGVQFVPIDRREENVGLVDGVDPCHV